MVGFFQYKWQTRLCVGRKAQIAQREVGGEKRNRGNWRQRKEDSLVQISNCEAVQEVRPLTDDEVLQKTQLDLEYEDVAKNEEMAWRQGQGSNG